MASNIVVPEVGESIVDARIAKWLRHEGDVVAAGDPLVELETDKIDLEVSAPQAGVLSRISRQDGEDVKVGEVLGVIEEAAAGKGAKPAGPGAGEGAEAAAPAPEANRQVSASQQAPAQRQAAQASAPAKGPRATPTARKAAEEHELDLSSVRGTGDAGRVMRRDVEQAARGTDTAQPAAVTSPAVEPPAPKPAPPVAEKPRAAAGDRTEERVRMSKRRATIARRLVEVQSTAAMLTTFNEVDMSSVMSLRERHKQAFKDRHGVGLGIASFFVKASVGALRAFPRINAEIQGDEMVLKHYYDIGVAVGASEGLVVPGTAGRRSSRLRRDRRTDPELRQESGGRHALAGRSQGRDLHDHQWRRVRVAAEHADSEPATGRHPRPAQNPGASRRRRRAGRRAADDVRCAHATTIGSSTAPKRSSSWCASNRSSRIRARSSWTEWIQ